MGYILNSASELIKAVPFFKVGPVTVSNATGQVFNRIPAFTSGKIEPIRYTSLFDGLASDILGRGSYLQFRAYGNSMAPFIRNGDIVLVEPKKANELRIGDIVFYRRTGGRHIAHRLIGKSRRGGSLALKTRGDNLRDLDASILPEQVLGRVIRIESQGRYLCIGGTAGCVLNRILLYASFGSGYIQDVLRRGLTKLWWLVGRMLK